MKSTGIIRRIDDLGRVVIPKEIRRALRIREGDPLELFTVQGGVCFKKYNPISDARDIVKSLEEFLDDCDTSPTRQALAEKIKEIYAVLDEADAETEGNHER